MKELKIKDALLLTGLILGGFIAYTLGGVFLKGFSDTLQIFIEQLLGYTCLSAFILSGIKDFIFVVRNGILPYIKYCSPIVSSSYSLMYFLYLAYNFGDSQVHISAIGFSLAALMYAINHMMMVDYKSKRAN